MRRGTPSQFVIVERAVLDDPRLSLAAKGLYAVVATWEPNQRFPADESLTPVLEELVAAGYAVAGDDAQFVVGWLDAKDDQEPPLPQHVPKPRAGTDSAGWAYAISDAAAEQVKIGASQDVARRLKGLQTSHPNELRVLWQGAGGAAMEAHLHARFARRRIRGEWFDFTGVDALKLITRAAESFRAVPR